MKQPIKNPIITSFVLCILLSFINISAEITFPHLSIPSSLISFYNTLSLSSLSLINTKKLIDQYNSGSEVSIEMTFDAIDECLRHLEHNPDMFTDQEIINFLNDVEEFYKNISSTPPLEKMPLRNPKITTHYAINVIQNAAIAGGLAVRENAFIDGRATINDGLQVNNNVAVNGNISTTENISAQNGNFSGTVSAGDLNVASVTFDIAVIGNGTDPATLQFDASGGSGADVQLIASGGTPVPGNGNLVIQAATTEITGTVAIDDDTTITGDILPAATTTYNVGSPLLRWDNVYSQDGDFSGTLTAVNFVLTNDITVNNATINNDLNVGNTATIGNGLTISAGGADITGDITEDGNILPNGVHDLGNIGARWDNVYANDGDFSGTLTANNFVLTNDITVNNAIINNDLTVGNDATITNNLAVDTDTLFVDAANDRVGINTSTPTVALDVIGAINISTMATIGTGLTVSAGGANITGNITEAGNILPSGSRDIGAVGNRWNNIFGVTANFSGTTTVGTGLTVSAGGANITGDITENGNILPSGSHTIGTSGTRWATIYGVNGDFTGTLTAASINIPTAQFDTLTVGNGSDPATLNFNSSGASPTDVQLIATGGTASSGQGNLAINAANTNVSSNLTVDTSVLVVNATTNRVGINNASPNFDLDVTGATNITSNLSVDTDTLFVDATNDRVGINTPTPTVALDVVGATNISTTATIGTGLTVSSGGANITGTLNQTGNILSTANLIFDLGSPSGRWATIYGGDGDFSGTLTVDTLNITTNITVPDVHITNDLTVDNLTTLNNELTITAGGADITGDITENGNILPSGSHTIGTSGTRWATIYGVNGDFTGTLTAASINIPTAQFDTLTVGNGSDPATLNFNSSGTSPTDVQLIATGGTASSGQGNLAINAANTNISSNLTVDTTTLVVDATNNFVGINKAVPAVALDVVGATNISTTATIGTGLTVSAGGASITGTINQTGDIIPTANTFNLGSSASRWANVFAIDGDFSGTLTVDTLNITNDITVNNATVNNDLVVANDTTLGNNLTVDTDTLIVDATNDRVGINTATPTVALDIVGATNISTTATIGTGLTISAGGANITGNITEAGNILPSGSRDIGASGNRWANIYGVNENLSGTLTTDNLTVNTNAIFNSGISVTAGGADIFGSINVTGNIVATQDATYELGNPGNRWLTLYAVDGDFTGTLTAASVNIPTAQFDTLTVGDGSDPATLNFNSSGASPTDVQLIATGGTGVAGQGNLAINAANTNVSSNLTVDTTTLVVDATNNFVGINKAVPAVALDVVGATNITSNLTVDTNTFFVNATTDRVGIGTLTPNEQLEITGNFRFPTTTSAVGQIKQGANRFIHSFGTNNLFFGTNSGNFTLTGANNSGFGAIALASLSSGGDNTTFGNVSGSNITTGSFNTTIGSASGRLLQTGSNNTLVGLQAGNSNVSGSSNTFIGESAGYNTTSSSNVAIGSQALVNNTSGSLNTAIGTGAGAAIVTGDNNTFLGRNANASGDFTNATAIGANATVGASNALVLGNSANVGIGTPTPAVKLDVVGAASISGNLAVDTNVLFVDSNNNRVGINNASPAVALDVTGATNITSNLTVDTNVLSVNATTNRVGINITTPQQDLDVVGNIQYQPTGTSAPAYRPIGSQNSFGLRIVRGTVSTPAAGAAIIQGEGFSVASIGAAGRVDITFTQAFTTAPSVVLSANQSGNYTVNTDTISTTGFRIFNTIANTGTSAAANVSFIAIGT